MPHSHQTVTVILPQAQAEMLAFPAWTWTLAFLFLFLFPLPAACDNVAFPGPFQLAVVSRRVLLQRMEQSENWELEDCQSQHARRRLSQLWLLGLLRLLELLELSLLDAVDLADAAERKLPQSGGIDLSAQSGKEYGVAVDEGVRPRSES